MSSYTGFCVSLVVVIIIIVVGASPGSFPMHVQQLKLISAKGQMIIIFLNTNYLYSILSRNRGFVGCYSRTESCVTERHACEHILL